VAKSIITTHPEVACAVCGRRLLRGEQPDVFLAGGTRLTVCELCVPRAAQEGWLRESDGGVVAQRSTRGQRGRSLLTRLRQRRERAAAAPEDVPDAGSMGDHRAADGRGAGAALGPAAAATSMEDVAPAPPVPAAPPSAPVTPTPPTPPTPPTTPVRAGAPPGPARATTPRAIVPVTNADLKAARALEVFNAGEEPRRVAGVARSLGAPVVAAQPAAESGSVVSIVVAWELCWYRYEVDLGEEDAGLRLVAQGTELDELAEHERTPNAAADERGELTMMAD
jgi:hypothetical protein